VCRNDWAEAKIVNVKKDVQSWNLTEICTCSRETCSSYPEPHFENQTVILSNVGVGLNPTNF